MVAVLIFDIFCTRVFAKGTFRRPLLACCAGKRFAFPQLRTLAGSNPSALGTKRKAPISGGLTIRWWAMRDVRVRLAPPAPRFVASLLACCAGKRFAFPQLRTLAGSNPSALGTKRKAPISGGLTIRWWAMRDVRVRLAPPAPRFVASLLACCAGKRFAFPQLRTLAGSNPSAMGPNKNGPLSRTVSNSLVGDEGFEPPALCV